MDNFEILETTAIHVELSSHCNAGCPMCTRHVAGTNKLRSNVKLSHIRYPQWVKFLNDLDRYSLQKMEFQFSGCLGDPCMTPDFFKIVHETHERGYAYQVITNGSIGSASKWAELGKISTDEKHEVHFSIDGLEDTNHLYRIGIEWKRIMANAKAFIDNGGYATWKFIIFEHNKHQVEEARALAKDMGFAVFDTVISTRNQWRDYEKEIALKVDTKKKQNLIPTLNVVDESDDVFNSTLLASRGQDIVCDAKTKSRLFIDADFNLWPCMYIGVGRVTEKTFYDIINPKDHEWNSLDRYDVDEILDHEFIRGLDKGNWCSICYHHCAGAGHRKMNDAASTKEAL